MESKERKILKITMEFTDKIQYLEGKEAERWLDAANSACTMEAIHGREFPAFSWKIKRKALESLAGMFKGTKRLKKVLNNPKLTKEN